MSLWADLAVAPPDAIFGVTAAYEKDPDPCKINLGVGAYRTDTGEPYVLNVVKKVEHDILNDAKINKEYLPIDGLPQLRKVAAGLIFGDNSTVVREGRVATIQSLSGTGALTLAAAFFKQFVGEKTVYLPSPTWGNHKKIFSDAGHKIAELVGNVADTSANCAYTGAGFLM